MYSAAGIVNECPKAGRKPSGIGVLLSRSGHSLNYEFILFSHGK